MSSWQNWYTISEQREILRKKDQGVNFPEKLYQLAVHDLKQYANWQRIEENHREKLPLIKEDITALTQLANDVTVTQPIKRDTKIVVEKRGNVKTKIKRHTNEETRQKLREMLEKYDGVLQSADELGLMQYEKYRRYRERAEWLVNDEKATTAQLSNQIRKFEVNIESLRERIARRQGREFY